MEPKHNEDARATARDRRRQDVSAEFLHWITISRELIADHFPAERAEPHNAMIIDTARTLMLADRLGGLESTLEGIRDALRTSKET